MGSSWSAPIRRVAAFEEVLLTDAENLEWARIAFDAIMAALPSAQMSQKVSVYEVLLDRKQLSLMRPKSASADADATGWSRRESMLVNMLNHAGWSYASVSNSTVSLYAVRWAMEVETNEGELFHPKYTSSPLGSIERPRWQEGVSRGCSDGTTEWIPPHRIRCVRLLNEVDSTD